MVSSNNISIPTPDSQTPISSISIDWSAKETVLARASMVGERLVLKSLEQTESLATNPLTIRFGETGCAVALRYGVIVTFNLSLEEESELIEALRPHIRDPIDCPAVSEELQMTFQPDVKERFERNILWLKECSTERLQIVAEALAKSVVLNYYEMEISNIFERIKPFTIAIQGKTPRPPKEEELLSYIGGTLLIQQKMFGIVEVGEKPDPVWDDPILDRLYLRLEDEYELRERLVALEQKLTLISRTVETSLSILQRNSSHRVEWYIVILIVVEIVLAIYDLWTR
ncbi:MAG: RMD1 family protein [Leptolyngbyaceae bacterium]|nr:RMD1 family protein [Leptolyngbyaceae bacterium]